MKWEDGRRSDNVEDRRGAGRTGAAIGGGGLVVVLLISLLTGRDPRQLLSLLNQGQENGAPAATDAPPKDVSPEEKRAADFVSAVLAETEDTWEAVFSEQLSGQRYERPKLVLFRDEVDSACGSASAAMGPFYCPGDHRVYLDLGFFDELQRRFGAPGEFARAYVIAHEVGHHVQALTGTSERVHDQQQAQPDAANRLSVRLELQADCYAGVWAHNTQKKRPILEAGDVEAALRAATAIGDDTLQRAARGRVVPESFTHGSSAQRVEWFSRGLKQGTLASCDTFGAGSLSGR